MRYSVLAAFNLLAVVLAAPAELPSRQLKKRSFIVERVPNPNFTGHDGPAALRKAYVKWGMTYSPSDDSSSEVSSRSTSGTETGDVGATPLGNDIEFVSPIQIGGQTFNMDFDTGSADLWVFSTLMPESLQAGHNIYDSSKSASFKPLEGATFNVQYGDSSGAMGTVGTDTVVVGGASVTSQAVELAGMVSPSFVTTTGSDGLMGLSFSKLNTVKPTPQNTFFENALPTLPEPVFTASLKHGTTGSYDFGIIDDSKFNGSLTWAPVNPENGFWQVTSSQFSINNGAPTQVTTSNAIIDTGTTLMIVNPVIINAYYSQVQGAQNSAEAGGIVFPCDADLPDLQIDIGGKYMANIPGSLIAFAPATTGSSLCYGGLQAGTSELGLQIFGDIFLKAQFVAFNGGNNSVGLAPHS